MRRTINRAFSVIGIVAVVAALAGTPVSSAFASAASTAPPTANAIVADSGSEWG